MIIKHRKFLALGDSNSGIIIENTENRLIIKNTTLGVEKVFENYSEVANNSLGLDSFINDYKNSDEKRVTEDEKYYILFAKIKNTNNKYISNKTLYINKESNEIEKIEIKDVNNNRTIFIEYTKARIL